MPSFCVLKNQEKETGVSVFFVDEGIDSGPIIEQQRVEIGSLTQEGLIKKTKKIGIELILSAIRKIKDNEVNLIPNPADEMTYFSFPTKQDVQEFKKNGAKFFNWL
jgi:methionyl-tRNA formyltransferase